MEDTGESQNKESELMLERRESDVFVLIDDGLDEDYFPPDKHILNFTEDPGDYHPSNKCGYV